MKTLAPPRASSDLGGKQPPFPSLLSSSFPLISSPDSPSRVYTHTAVPTVGAAHLAFLLIHQHGRVGALEPPGLHRNNVLGGSCVRVGVSVTKFVGAMERVIHGPRLPFVIVYYDVACRPGRGSSRRFTVYGDYFLFLSRIIKAFLQLCIHWAGHKCCVLLCQ